MAIHRISFSPAEPVRPGTSFLFSLPFDTPTQRVLGFELENAADVTVLTATNARQQALAFRATTGEPRVIVDFEDREAGSFAPGVFTAIDGPHERPSAALSALMGEVAPASLPPLEKAWRVIRHVEERFTYGKRPVGLGDDADAMPALECGLHQGTCIDSHTYTVAAMRAAGLEAAYVSGVFFYEGDTVYPVGHCWVALDVPGIAAQIDVSHHIEYDLGPVTEALNPKPGTRFALSQGRDFVFETADGPLGISLLSGFIVAEGAERGTWHRTLAAWTPVVADQSMEDRELVAAK